MPTSTIDRATSLNRDCHCINTDVQLVQRWIQEELARNGITDPVVSTHPHLFSALPVFVDSGHLREAHALMAAVESVIALRNYQEVVLRGAPAVARFDAGATGAFLGYDFHFGPEGPQLIEININAGGAMLNTLLMRAQHACCPEVQSSTPSTKDIEIIEQRFVEMFQHEWMLSRADVPLRRIAIVDDNPKAQFLYPEFLLFKRLFESHGIEAVIADAAAIEFDGVTAMYEGRSIDLIYNRLTDFLLEQPEHAGMKAAFVAGATMVTPHPRSHALYANKGNLTLLSDESKLRELGASDETIQILLRHIPCTKTVLADARSEWWAQRQHWFFKPTSSYAGRGAYRGDKLTRKTFEDIMAGSYVAQAIMPPSTRSRQTQERPLRWDLRIYAYQSVPLLHAARLYDGQTTNFRTPGGGFAPVFIASSNQAASAQLLERYRS